MSCKDKDGGTHHFACDCREAYVRRLEKVAKAAEKRLDVWTSETYQELRDALASLMADVDVK